MNIAVRSTIDLDRREAILERLLVIGQGLSGIASAYRNHGPPTTGVLGVPRPTFLLFDGGTKLTQDVRMHKSTRMPPTIWNMSPQIVILLQSRDRIENDILEGVVNPVGPEVSRWMNLVNAAVVNDPSILNLVTANGTHYLSAVETDLKIPRAVGALGAWVMLLFEFFYPMFPVQN